MFLNCQKKPYFLDTIMKPDLSLACIFMNHTKNLCTYTLLPCVVCASRKYFEHLSVSNNLSVIPRSRNSHNE